MTRATRLFATRPEDQASIDDIYREAERIERGRTLFTRMADAGENDRRRAASTARRESLEAFDALRVTMQRRHDRRMLVARVLIFVAVVATGVIMVGRVW